MIEVEAPDGTIIEFPDSMSAEQIEAVMAQSFAAPQPIDEAMEMPSGGQFMTGPSERPWYDDLAVAVTSKDTAGLGRDVEKFGRNVVEGLQDASSFVDGTVRSAVNTFLPGDEFSALMSSKTGVGNRGDGTYGGNLQAERAYSDNLPLEERIAGPVAGALTLGRVLPVRNPTPAGLAKDGAMIGAVSGFSSGRGDTFSEGLENRLTNAAVGGGIGAAGGAAAGKLSQVLSRSVATPPTAEALKSRARQAYQAADDAGVIVSRDKYRSFVDGLTARMANEGIAEGIHSRSLGALKRIMSVDENVSLKGLETLRKTLRAAAATPDKADARLAMMMIDDLDDMIFNLGRADVLTGNPAAGAAALKEARAAWAKASKTEVISEAIAKAETNAKSLFGGSGKDNALRTAFRQIANSPKKSRWFNEQELAAIKKVAEGGPVENALRMLGKFAPSTPLYMTPHVGAGIMTGGIEVPALMAAGGAGFRGAAGVATRRNAALAEALMRNGGPVVTQGKLTPLQAQLLSSGVAAQAVLPSQAISQKRAVR